MTVSGGIHHILSSNSHRSSAFHPTQPDGLVDTIKTAPRACPDWKVVSIGAKEQSVDDPCLERGRRSTSPLDCSRSHNSRTQERNDGDISYPGASHDASRGERNYLAR